MALPPRGDPRRDVSIAVRYLWLMAALMGVLSLSQLGTLRVLSSGPQGIRNAGEILAMVSLLALGPGILYAISAEFLRRRAKWACGVAKVVAVMQFAVFGGSGLAGSIMLIGRGEAPIWQIFWSVLGLLIGAAMLWLMLVLRRASAAIERMPDDIDRGFEPVAPTRVEAVEGPNAGRGSCRRYMSRTPRQRQREGRMAGSDSGRVLPRAAWIMFLIGVTLAVRGIVDLVNPMETWERGVISGLYGVPAALYVLCAAQVLRARRWAVIVGRILAVTFLLISSLGLVGFALAMRSMGDMAADVLAQPIVIADICINLGIIPLSIYLLFLLARAPHHDRGFDPILPRRVEEVEDDASPGA